MNRRTLADPNWAATLQAQFRARDRFEQFMGDPRATDAILCEAAQATPGCATPMDVEDFVRYVLKARVDVHGQDPRVLRRWGVI